MRVTPWNILKFWKRLMFPPNSDIYRYNRLIPKADMPWEPWLHATVWIAMFLILLAGEEGVVPPVDGVDWCWLAFGLIAPPIGFFSVWTLEFHTGRPRYYALWGRMVADAGLVMAIGLHQIARFDSNNQLANIGWGRGVLPNIVLFAAMWFTATLVWRDVAFIIATEKLSAQIYKDVHSLTVDEWASEWGDDADR